MKYGGPREFSAADPDRLARELRKLSDELARLCDAQSKGNLPQLLWGDQVNADAALWGAYDEGGLHPTEAQRAVIRSMRDEHIADLTASVRQNPPAAFILVSRSPLMSSADAVADFEKHCPEASAYMHEHYTDLDQQPAGIWLRSDLAPPVPPPPSEPEEP